MDGSELNTAAEEMANIPKRTRSSFIFTCDGSGSFYTNECLSSDTQRL